MKITARNFGPVRTATVEPSRLTVLVGPNNSGKSVMATLLHATVLASPNGYERPGGPRRPFRAAPDLASQLAPAEREANAVAFRKLLDRPQLRSGDIPAGLLELFETHVDRTLNYFAQSIRREVEQAFGSRIHDLHRREAKRRGQDLEIIVTGSKPAWAVKITALGGRGLRTEYDIQRPENLAPIAAHALRRLSDFVKRHEEYRVYLDQDDVVALRWSFTWVGREFLDQLPYTSYYLPAARSGVMQSHRALASAVVSQAPLAGLERMEVPRMAGVVSDFLSTLIQLDQESEDSDLTEVARFLEGNIMQGRVRVEDRLGYPEILYAPAGGASERGRDSEFRLHRTSSMISELAPLVLYLRHVIHPWSLLVIEEPESSLHPESQLRLAEAIAMIVNAGVQVVITTHSDYFLTVLNQAIQTATLIAEDKDPGVDMPPLRAGQVGAYLFLRKPAGTTVKRLPVSDRYGIAEADFLSVAEELYDTSVELDEQF